MASGLKGIKTIRDLEITDKIVFLRLDLNVPMSGGKISDDTRIVETLPTIKYALEKGAKLVLASHLGRPKNADDVQFSLEPVATRLSELLGADVNLLDDPESDAVKHLITGLKKNQIILLENLRFVEGETKNSPEFAQILASYSQVYVNDAFGASHRAHASIEALPNLMKDKAIGFLIEKEIKMLDQLLDNPARPYLAVLGGAKVSDKIEVIEKLIDLVDGFIIGGAMAYTFLRGQNMGIGKSKIEADKVSYAREMVERIKSRNKTLLLPVDHLAAENFSAPQSQLVTTQSLPETLMGLDIGPKTIELFSTAIAGAKTIFWNGPMGVFENETYAKGTFAIAKAIAQNSGIRIVGGGDSAAAAHASGFAEKMTHISTGGGASLEYLQGEKLPGLEVLRTRVRT